MDFQTLIALILIFGLIGFPIWIWWRNRQREKQRQDAILEYWDDWGAEICTSLVNKQVGIDMTQKMVVLAWGQPSYADQREVTKKGEKIRWVYGKPRRDASYVWFTDNKVTKIKT